MPEVTFVLEGRSSAGVQGAGRRRTGDYRAAAQQVGDIEAFSLPGLGPYRTSATSPPVAEANDVTLGNGSQRNMPLCKFNGRTPRRASP